MSEELNDVLRAFEDMLEVMTDRGLLSEKGIKLRHELWAKVWKEKEAGK